MRAWRSLKELKELRISMMTSEGRVSRVVAEVFFDLMGLAMLWRGLLSGMIACWGNRLKGGVGSSIYAQ